MAHSKAWLYFNKIVRRSFFILTGVLWSASSTAQDIQGDFSPCPGTEVQYSTNNVDDCGGANMWNVFGGSIVRNISNRSVIVKWSNVDQTGPFWRIEHVYRTDRCSSPAILARDVSVRAMYPISRVSGESSVLCGYRGAVRYVVPEPPAFKPDSYIWRTNTGWVGTSSSSVIEYAVTNDLAGYVEVTGLQRTCNQTTNTFRINIGRIVDISTGRDKDIVVCRGGSVGVGVSSIAAESYTWTAPPGFLINNASTTLTTTSNAVTLNESGAVEGTVGVLSVVANRSSCGSSVPLNFNVHMGVPPRPDGILGLNKQMCRNRPGQYLGVHQSPFATGYVWTVGYGATLVAGQGTNTIVVNPLPVGGTAPYYFKVGVKAVNACGLSAAFEGTGTTIYCSPNVPDR